METKDGGRFSEEAVSLHVFLHFLVSEGVWSVSMVSSSCDRLVDGCEDSLLCDVGGLNCFASIFGELREFWNCNLEYRRTLKDTSFTQLFVPGADMTTNVYLSFRILSASVSKFSVSWKGRCIFNAT